MAKCVLKSSSSLLCLSLYLSTPRIPHKYFIQGHLQDTSKGIIGFIIDLKLSGYVHKGYSKLLLADYDKLVLADHDQTPIERS